MRVLITIWAVLAAGAAASLAMDPASRPSTADEIAREATLPNTGLAGRPLPLASTWNTGEWNSQGLTPELQVALIESGHYVLPAFAMPAPKAGFTSRLREYYRKPLERAAQLGLPICFVGTQWEHVLTDEKRFWQMPPETNPNVVGADGRLKKKLSPFGGVELWSQAGHMWTDTDVLRQFQEWYPTPPLVLMVSNNEHTRLWPREAETAKQYLDLYGPGRDDRFKHDLFAEAYAKRYRALQEGMRQGLSSPDWRKNAAFIGYQSFTRTGYEKATQNPNPQSWDGGSAGYYVGPEGNDASAVGVQTLAAAWMHNSLPETYRLNPAFWLELSTWDGQVSAFAGRTKPYASYASMAETFTPRRYGGVVQMGMWLLRPRVVREYRDGDDSLLDCGPYFMQVVSAVDRVWLNETLREFWRYGKNVPNPNTKNSLRAVLPWAAPEFCLLDTNLDPKLPMSPRTTVKVFATALVLGDAPQRRWLLYAHAPAGDTPVTVTLPEYGDVDLDATVEGSYSLVSERGRQVAQVQLVDLRAALKTRLAFK